MSESPGVRWPAEHVWSLAPDPASVTAARKLVVGSGWSEEGCSARAVWGNSRGSGRTPYRAMVDLAGPAYQCSCPSRKFPCKHALALLVRWSGGSVPALAVPATVQAWLDGRDERAARSATRATAAPRTPDPVAAAKRAEQRADRVAGGLDELDRWLVDQIRGGLAGLQSAGYSVLATVAARMVDAQAPGVASWLRGLTAVLASGPGWPQRLLEELALLRLLVRAHRRLDEIDSAAPHLAASLRSHVGYPVSRESVLARPAVSGTWSVQGLRDTELDTLTQRTVWVQEVGSGRMATVLSFAPTGQSLDATLVPGTCLQAGLHYYPGAHPLRALVGEHGAPGPAPEPEAGSVEDALAAVAGALAADPWTRGHPAWVAGVPTRHGTGWAFVDEVGDGLPLRAGVDPWRLVAAAGGRRVPVLLDWSPAGWRPIAVYADRLLAAA